MLEIKVSYNLDKFDTFFGRVSDPDYDQRPGQWAFNLLQELRPDLAKKVKGTLNDPFYVDSRLCWFTLWVLENWDGPLHE